MAEIPIERKQRGSRGPMLLILLLIVLAVAGWYLWTNYGDRSQIDTTISSVTPSARTAAGAVPAIHILRSRRT